MRFRSCTTGLVVASLTTLLHAEVVIRHDRTIKDAARLAAPHIATVQVSMVGSGVLIAPQWVLTAAHVADGLSPHDPFVHVDGRRFEVDRIHRHPRSFGDPWTPPPVDMALLRLKAPVDSVAPLPLYRDVDEAGRDATIVGYGDFGVAGRPLKRTDGVRRAVSNVIDEVSKDHLVITFDADGSAMEGVGAPGDSGGPLLIERDGAFMVAGVSSNADGPVEQYGVRDIYGRVSSIAAWIDETMADPPEGALLPRVHDVRRGGLPADAHPELINGLADAVSKGDLASLVEFSRLHRLDGARLDLPDDVWAAEVHERAMGRVTLLAHARGRMGDDQYLVQDADGRRWIIFMLVQEGKIDGMMVVAVPQ